MKLSRNLVTQAVPDDAAADQAAIDEIVVDEALIDEANESPIFDLTTSATVHNSGDGFEIPTPSTAASAQEVAQNVDGVNSSSNFPLMVPLGRNIRTPRSRRGVQSPAVTGSSSSPAGSSPTNASSLTPSSSSSPPSTISPSPNNNQLDPTRAGLSGLV